jgi:hypothetical protein
MYPDGDWILWPPIEQPNKPVGQASHMAGPG